MKEITVILPIIIESGTLTGRDVVAVMTNVGLPGPPGISGKTFVYSFSGDLSVALDPLRLYAEDKMKIVRVRASLGVPCSGQAVILQVYKNGSPIYTTPANRPTIAVGANTVEAGLPDDIYLLDGDYLTVGFDQVGIPAPGVDCTLQIRGEFIP